MRFKMAIENSENIKNIEKNYLNAIYIDIDAKIEISNQIKKLKKLKEAQEKNKESNQTDTNIATQIANQENLISQEYEKAKKEHIKNALFSDALHIDQTSVEKAFNTVNAGSAVAEVSTASILYLLAGFFREILFGKAAPYLFPLFVAIKSFDVFSYMGVLLTTGNINREKIKNFIQKLGELAGNVLATFFGAKIVAPLLLKVLGVAAASGGGVIFLFLLGVNFCMTIVTGIHHLKLCLSAKNPEEKNYHIEETKKYFFAAALQGIGVAALAACLVFAPVVIAGIVKGLAIAGLTTLGLLALSIAKSFMGPILYDNFVTCRVIYNNIITPVYDRTVVFVYSNIITPVSTGIISFINAITRLFTGSASDEYEYSQVNNLNSDIQDNADIELIEIKNNSLPKTKNYFENSTDLKLIELSNAAVNKELNDLTTEISDYNKRLELQKTKPENNKNGSLMFWNKNMRQEKIQNKLNGLKLILEFLKNNLNNEKLTDSNWNPNSKIYNDEKNGLKGKIEELRDQLKSTGCFQAFNKEFSKENILFKRVYLALKSAANLDSNDKLLENQLTVLKNKISTINISVQQLDQVDAQSDSHVCVS